MKGKRDQTLFEGACSSDVKHAYVFFLSAEYFTQFGRVSKVRLSRNKKSGKSKHYAFLEFQTPEVAKVVADAMDGYHFFGQKLQVRALSCSEVHPELFKGANRVFTKIPWKKIEEDRHNKDRNPEQEAKRVKANAKRAKLRQARIKAAGIDYEFEVEHENIAKSRETTAAVEKLEKPRKTTGKGLTPSVATKSKRSRAPALETGDTGTDAKKKSKPDPDPHGVSSMVTTRMVLRTAAAEAKNNVAAPKLKEKSSEKKNVAAPGSAPTASKRITRRTKQ